MLPFRIVPIDVMLTVVEGLVTVSTHRGTPMGDWIARRKGLRFVIVEVVDGIPAPACLLRC